MRKRRKKNKIKKYIQDKNLISRFLVLFIFTFIAAIVYNAYIVPNNIVFGGMSGLAIIFNSFYELSPVIYMNILSIITLILGFIILGFKETCYGIIGYLSFTLMVDITSPFASLFSLSFDSRLIDTLIYAVLYGASLGFIYRTGFNTAGADTIVEILKKFTHKPIGLLSNIVNGIIILTGLFIFGVTNAIYAVIFLIVENKVADYFLIGSSFHKLCYIYTKDQDEVIKYIEKDLQCGYTMLDSTNGIGFLNRRVVLCVIPSDRFSELKMEIRKIDKKAKIISDDCYTVEGGTINSLLFV